MMRIMQHYNNAMLHYVYQSVDSYNLHLYSESIHLLVEIYMA